MPPPLQQDRVGHPGEQALASRVDALVAARFETRAQERYRRASPNEHGGTDIRKSESPIVPTKAGNQLEGTRWRKGEAGSRNRRTERWRGHRAR